MILDEQLINAISEAISQKKPLNFQSDTTKVKVNSDDNSYSIVVEYKKPNDVALFKEYVSNLPDDIFTEACELLGNEKITTLSNQVDGDDFEKIREGIAVFKEAVRTCVRKKLAYYKNFLN